MDNPEKVATLGTQVEEKQNKNTTQRVMDTTIRKQTQITWKKDLRRGGKDEPDIVFIRKSQRTSQHGT